MNGKKYDVVSVGIQCIDIVAAPVAAGVLEREMTPVRQIQLMLGGDALNQAVVLAQLGAKVGLIGIAGRDRMGNILVDQLSAIPGLDVLDQRVDVNTTVSIVLIDSQGERHFVLQPDSNLALSYEHIDEDAVKNAAFVAVGGSLALPALDGEGMLRLMDLAHASGAQTVMDFRIASEGADPEYLRALLSRVDYVLPSEQEAQALTGEGKDPVVMVERLRALGASNCIIKLGGHGCYVAADGFTGMVAAYPCNCVDTTGAGDTFVGAFLYAKTRGWDIERCVKFACAAGSIAVEHSGANAAIQSEQQVLDRMNGRA